MKLERHGHDFLHVTFPEFSWRDWGKSQNTSSILWTKYQIWGIL